MKTIVLSVTCLMAVLTGTASAVVFYVHPDSSQDSIQPCLDACSDNDVVLVGPGTYYENLVWPNTQGIQLISEFGRDTTFIDGGANDVVVRVEQAVDSTTLICGFTIRNGSAHDAGGIFCSGASPTILDNVIRDNVSSYNGGGIECYSSSHPRIIGNIITANRTPWGGGIECWRYSSPFISGNTITSNIADTTGGGVLCMEGSSPTIYANEISGNSATWCGGIGMANASHPVVDSNQITGNAATNGGGGIGCAESNPIITHNRVEGNTAGTSSGGIGLLRAAPTIRRNLVQNNTAMQAGGGIGADSASMGLIDSNDIRLNHAQANGGGIACGNSTTTTISHNTLYGNSSDSCGGGIHCWSTSPMITGNGIDSNYAVVAGGGIYCLTSSPTITGNTITRNSVSSPSQTYAGGGIVVRSQSHPLVESNDIMYNTAPFGGGIGCYYSSNPQIIGNRIVGNEADSVGGGLDIFSSSSPTLRLNRITGNTAVLGGGMSCWDDCSPMVESCNVRDNVGDGFYCRQGSYPHVRVSHSNIAGNSPYGIRSESSADSVIATECWWGHSSGPYHPVLNDTGLGDTVSDWVLFRPWLADSIDGVEESGEPEARGVLRTASVVRGVLLLPAGSEATLLDITGRRVADLAPGPNDIGHISPGIYFVRREDGSPTAKVIVQR